MVGFLSSWSRLGTAHRWRALVPAVPGVGERCRHHDIRFGSVDARGQVVGEERRRRIPAGMLSAIGAHDLDHTSQVIGVERGEARIPTKNVLCGCPARIGLSCSGCAGSRRCRIGGRCAARRDRDTEPDARSAERRAPAAGKSSMMHVGRLRVSAIAAKSRRPWERLQPSRLADLRQRVDDDGGNRSTSWCVQLV